MSRTNGKRSKVKSIVVPVIILVVIVGGFYGGYFALQAYLGSETPIVVVTSESMHPVYWEGDILFVKYATPEEIPIGADIVFHADWIPQSDPNSDIPVVHRVIDKQFISGEWYFWTQGVNSETNPYPDPAPTPYSNVIGVVVFAIPRIGLPLLFLRSAIGIVGIQIFFIIIAGILISYIIYDYYSDGDVNKEKNKTDENKKNSLWSSKELDETEKLEEERKEN